MSRMRLAVALVAAFLATPVLADDPPIRVSGLQPVSPQPANGAVQPGLAVIYFKGFFDHISHIDKLGKGAPGKPIPELNLKTTDGYVLTSNLAMGVGARINGMVNLDKPGTWTFRVNSNDGIKIAFGGKHVFEDPTIHGDTMSPAMELMIEKPGWYALDIDYYQRKGTSALQLFWTPPGEKETIVPAAAYAHLKK